MIEVVVAPQARADIAQIIDYLASAASPATAALWSNKLWAMVAKVSEFPGSGAARTRLGEHIRIRIVTPYIVIYEYELGAPQAYILRVLHGRRRITRRLVQSRV